MQTCRRARIGEVVAVPGEEHKKRANRLRRKYMYYDYAGVVWLLEDWNYRLTFLTRGIAETAASDTAMHTAALSTREAETLRNLSLATACRKRGELT